MKRIALPLACLVALFCASLASGQTVNSGSITSTQCVSIDITQRSTVGIHVEGTWTGTLQPSVAMPGSLATKDNIQVTNRSTGTDQSTITANAFYQARIAGAATFFLCGNTVASGTAAVTVYASSGVSAGSGGGGGGTVTSVSGSAPVASSGGNTPAISCPTCAVGPGASTANHLATFSGTDGLTLADGGAVPSSTFSAITGSTNTSAAMVVGTGGSLATSGTGTITATNGVGASTSSAAPVMAYYLAPQCPAANTGNCFQTPANTQVVQNCTFNTGTANVVCASGTFASTDVGKFIWGFDSCNPFLSQPRTIRITDTHDTINAFVSSSTVTMNAVGVSGTTTTGCVVFGNTDDTAAAALDTALASLVSTPVCPKLFLSAAGYMFTTPHFFANPPACTATPAMYGGGSLGNLFYASGFELEGRGPATTILWVTPGFPESGTCTHGVGSVSCFAVPLEGKFSNFQITCGSGQCGPAGSASMINVDVGSLEYFTCTGWGDKAGANRAGVRATSWAQLQQVNISACGDVGIEVAGGAQVTGFRVSSEVANSINSNSANLLSDTASIFKCYDCKFFGSQTTTATLSNIVSNNGTVRLIGGNISTQAGSNEFFYQCLTLTCKLYMTDVETATVSTNSTGIFCSAACVVDLLRTPIVAAGTGAPFNNNQAASILINRGGNTFTGGAASSNSGFTLNLDSQGAAGITSAKAVLSAGWGSTAAWSALTGGNSFTGTISSSGTGQGLNPTITYTFPTPLPPGATPFCRADQVGGTHTPAGTFAATAVSRTGVTFTYSSTPVAAETFFVQVFCQ